MNYQIDSPAPLAQNFGWLELEGYGTIEQVESAEPDTQSMVITVTEDDYNVPLLEELLTAIRAGIVKRVVIWEK